MKNRAVIALAAASIAAAPASAFAADGNAVYTQACAVCHASGVGGAPRTGDKAAWSQRLAQGGQAAMVAAVLKGKGAMPPKGGNASLTENDVKAATEYLLSQAK